MNKIIFTDVIRFDNTYSWMKSKKVYYNIEVLEPDTETFPNSSSSSSQASFDSCQEWENRCDSC